MSVATVADLVAALTKGHLLEAARMQELPALQASFPDVRALLRELVKRGWLTPYQANALVLGRGEHLLLGSYVLLERLGEGGMGRVFKARHWKLGRTVALKVIRKERMANPALVRRFQREILAAARLAHPNIVRAEDADEVSGTHFLVMECVDGTSLARRVRQVGPLPVELACEVVRQTALALQHAHERGLTHRDVKPSNLLLTPEGQVKVLDMGLARLDAAGAEDESGSSLSQVGVLMGTPDYVAPEQALDPHAADIRADLYSLGCTFYFLLAGRPPFAGVSVAEKLLQHQMDEPVPLGQLRPEVPSWVAAVVSRLMAKRLEDRLQTPAELVAALAAGAGPASPQAGPAAVASCSPPVRRSPRAWLAVGGVAFGVLLLGGVVLMAWLLW